MADITLHCADRIPERAWVIAMVVLVSAGTAVGMSAQAPVDQSPSVDRAVAFELTVVKLNRILDSARRISLSTSGFNATNVTVKDLLRAAYGIEGFQLSDQIVGGPDWIETDRFDVAGRVDLNGGPVPPSRLLEMLKTLLAQRFNASVRPEVRERPVYALVVSNPRGPQGPRLKVSTLNCDDFFAGRPMNPAAREACQLRVRPGQIIGATTMANLARNLSPVVERIVIDKTGVSGLFELELTWVADSAIAQPDAAVPTNPVLDGVSIFTALQEQAGLRLQGERGPVRVLVVDRIDRPTPD
jgi:uncharacterized protein (TIGR03435 family)